MENRLSSFSLTIGTLEFGTKSLSYILFAIFLLGILTGLYSIIHINNPTISYAATLPILLAFILPGVILVKGIREAKEINPTSAE